MQAPENPAVSIVLLSYNNAKYIPSCLKSIYTQTYSDFEVIAVDNASSDNSVEEFSKFPVTLIKSETNTGGCEGVNIGIRKARGRFVLLLNIDTRLRPDALGALVDFMEANPQYGACQGKILIGNTGNINSAGNAMNPLGHTWCVGLNEKDAGQYPERELSSVSGACFFLRKKVLDHVGLYDPDLFLYNEDADLSLRCLLYGYRLGYCKDAVVEHEYSVSVDTRTKYYYLERNRWVVLFKNYESFTLLCLAPLLLIQEVGILMYAAWKGLLAGKFKGYFWVFSQLRRTRKKRKIIQRERKCTDREVLGLLEKKFGYGDIQNSAVTYILNPLLKTYLGVFYQLRGISSGKREQQEFKDKLF